jgi:HPt (histidine-containing phosphotransfer) domain-containing protein
VSDPKIIDRTLALLDPVPMEEAFGEIDDMAVETYHLFLTTTEPMLADILRHLNASQLEQATDVAHSAKGAARMTGAFRLASVYAQIEAASKRGDRQAALEWAELVPASFDEVRQEIKRVAASMNQ